MMMSNWGTAIIDFFVCLLYAAHDAILFLGCNGIFNEPWICFFNALIVVYLVELLSIQIIY
jgi:hypothetical protein